MQTDQKWQAFAEHMSYEASLHVAVEPLVATLDSVSRHNERSLQVLRSLVALDERRVEGSDDDDPLAQELQRMDNKLNILLDIVNRLLLPANLLPARHPVRFNAQGMVLPASLLPGSDAVLVHLHMDACRALPLEIPAQPGQSLDDGNAFIHFLLTGEAIENEIERFVFCQHRRKVAESRQSLGT